MILLPDRRAGLALLIVVADLILVDGDPLADIDLIGDPGRRFVVIMKDGVVYKGAGGTGRTR